jgi:hypothetical protein
MSLERTNDRCDRQKMAAQRVEDPPVRQHAKKGMAQANRRKHEWEHGEDLHIHRVTLLQQGHDILT